MARQLRWAAFLFFKAIGVNELKLTNRISITSLCIPWKQTRLSQLFPSSTT